LRRRLWETLSEGLRSALFYGHAIKRLIKPRLDEIENPKREIDAAIGMIQLASADKG
jgi:hypothetical protein